MTGVLIQIVGGRAWLIPLITLVQWADTSTTDSSEQFNPLVKRAAALALASTLVIDSASASFIASTINSFSTIANASDSAIDIDISFVSVKVNAKVSGISFVSAIASLIASDSDRAVAISFASVTSIFITNPKLADLLSQIKRMSTTVSADWASMEDWKNWADELKALWLEALGLTQADLTFNKEEAEALQNYLYATELLLKGKDAAVRIPKQAWAELEARLLTYPS